jgi:ribonucleoside-triphosphate reductase
MYQVVKRDGAVMSFDISKISAAIGKAFSALDKHIIPTSSICWRCG